MNTKQRLLILFALIILICCFIVFDTKNILCFTASFTALNLNDWLCSKKELKLKVGAILGTIFAIIGAVIACQGDITNGVIIFLLAGIFINTTK